MNAWNVLHVFAPFSALLTAISLLDKMPRSSCSSFNNAACEYQPTLYIAASLVFLAIASFVLLLTKETKGSFLAFFTAYPFWLFVAITPLFVTTALAGAWLSFIVMLIATVLQVLICARISEI